MCEKTVKKVTLVRRRVFKSRGDGVTRTQQQFKDDSDINLILGRYARTGGSMTPGPNDPQPIYGDFSNGEDFNSAQLKIANAKSSFESYPPDIREKFANNPALMLDFIDNPANEQQAIEMGLLLPRPPEVKEPSPAPKPETVNPPKEDENKS